MNLTPKMKLVLESLRRAHESEYRAGWGSVYLDNAKPKEMSRRSYAGVLSALEKAGLYMPNTGGDAIHQGCFGEVKLGDAK